MTERLTDLMYAEADLLDVPAPRTSSVLDRGRRLRRRRHVLQVGVGVASVALLAGLTVAAVSGDDDSGDALDPSAPTTVAPTLADAGAVFAIGPEVHLTGLGVTAEIADVTVKSMYYTSAGVLVRHGDNNYSDGGGDQRYSLVGLDGTVKPIDVVTNEVVPGVDIEQALLAYAEADDGPDGPDGPVEVVVHDLTTDVEIARWPVPEATEWGGWSAPPVSLVGDDVYVGTDDIGRIVDWRTGEVREANNTPPGFPPLVYGGLATEVFDEVPRVYDPATGTTLLDLPQDPDAYDVSLSPDGQFAKVDAFSGQLHVYSVESGIPMIFSGDNRALQWAPDGTLFSLDDAGVLTTCSPGSGDCATEQLDLDVLPNSLPGAENFRDDLVLGNQVRES